MVVCKFFLQGYCRFGDNCKFEHQINDTPDSKKTQHASILWQSQLNSSQYQNKNNYVFQKQNAPVFNLQDNNPVNSSTEVDVDTLIKSVVNDMTGVEKGGQWLLSCYGPFKEKPVFPGFEDYSFEEIRSGFYDAIKNGTIEQYKQHVNSLLQQAIIRIKSLQKPTPEIVEILKSLYNTSVSKSTPSSIFGNGSTLYSPNSFGQQNSTIFAQANQFVKPTSAGSIFGGSQAANSQPQASNQNIFAQANANVGSQNNSSIFASQLNNTIAPATGNVFSTQPLYSQSSSQPNVFASQNIPIFQQQKVTTNNLFGNQNSTQFQVTQPIVQSSPNQSVFGVNQNPTHSFSQQPPLGFGSNFVTSSPVVQSQKSSIFQNQTENTLNNAQLFTSSRNEIGQNIFGAHVNVAPLDEKIYSKLEELTDDEIKWFQSDDLDPRNIPEKPPTFDICFKT